MTKMIITVIGGGAGGFFAAINCAEKFPEHRVIILEKTKKLLSKVRVSGGGRCNVTNDSKKISDLIQSYPRGAKFLKKVFRKFAVIETIEWFESRGVPLLVEEDGRFFPKANSSEVIIDCFMRLTKRYNIEIRTGCEVKSIKKDGECWKIGLADEHSIISDRVIVATGGFPRMKGYSFLSDLAIDIVQPAPSLFTYNLRQKDITIYKGLSVPNARVKVVESNTTHTGPMLITHWGLSGPAILKSSAFNARKLQGLEYRFEVLVSWIDQNEELLREQLYNYKTALKHRQLANKNPFDLPNRLWEYLLDKAKLPHQKEWLDTSKPDLNRLLNTLLYDRYAVQGKTTFKEEFVTCGGVSLKEVDPKTMQSKKHPGIYFTGEVLDIDGVTGGFNFQAAWSTAFLASNLD